MLKSTWTKPQTRGLAQFDTVIATAKDEERLRARIPGPATTEVLRLQMKDEHRKLTSGGWYFRTDHGWVIYSDPQTGRWYTLKDALKIFSGSPQQHLSTFLR
jgi:hypothetical protein